MCKKTQQNTDKTTNTCTNKYACFVAFKKNTNTDTLRFGEDCPFPLSNTQLYIHSCYCYMCVMHVYVDVCVHLVFM